MIQWQDPQGLENYAALVAVMAGCLLFSVELVIDFLRRIVGVV